jgi:pimeloyl-ACP methyl ester carboxylesterase
MKKLRGAFLAISATFLLVFAGGVAFWLRPVEVSRKILFARMAINGFESRTTSVAGHRVHYDAIGPGGGQPVVLVHGLGASAEDWVKLAPLLAHAGFRVYMPDLLGYGRSDKPPEFSYSIADEADAVIGFLDALGLKQVDLGGWSMGGWVVQWVAAHHPERVRRLMLFDSAGLSIKPDWNTALFTPRNADELNQLEALLSPHPENIPAFVVNDVLRILQENAWVIHRALDSMLSGRDATDELLPSLKMPVLIVWGALDRVTPPSEADMMHKLIPQSQLDMAPMCGHLAPSQCAGAIAPRVVEFLRQ